LPDVVFVGMVGKLTKLAAGVLMTHYTRSAIDRDLLSRITADVGGSVDLVEQVREANTARQAYQLWAEAELLDAAGTLMCERVREVLERFSENRLRARVAMVDPDDGRLVAATSEFTEFRTS
jgi:cobalt-precorrin-5B (C1)-methyltransferase